MDKIIPTADELRCYTEVRWFDNIGIVKTKDRVTGELKIYIGAGYGVNERMDIQHIIDWGVKTDVEMLRAFLADDGGGSDE